MKTRHEIEINVGAINTPLKSKVREMSLVELLCNCHPASRADWASKLYKEKLLTKEEALQFTKIM